MPYLNLANGEIRNPTLFDGSRGICARFASIHENRWSMVIRKMIGTALVAQQHSKRLDSWFAIDEQSWTVGVFDGFELQLMQTALD
jgi:hypothetical protein